MRIIYRHVCKGINVINFFQNITSLPESFLLLINKQVVDI